MAKLFSRSRCSSEIVHKMVKGKITHFHFLQSLMFIFLYLWLSHIYEILFLSLKISSCYQKLINVVNDRMISQLVIYLSNSQYVDSSVNKLFVIFQHKGCLWSQCGKVWGFLTSHGSWSLGLARLHLSSVSPVISPLSSNDPFTCISFDKGLQSLTHNLEVQILWKPRVCNSFIVQHDPITFGSKSWHEWSYNYS